MHQFGIKACLYVHQLPCCLIDTVDETHNLKVLAQLFPSLAGVKMLFTRFKIPLLHLNKITDEEIW